VTVYFVAVAVAQLKSTATSRRRRDTLADILPANAVTVAQFNASDIVQTRYFTVGDGQRYGGYFNAPLDSGNYYTIYYVVASSLDNVTKMASTQTASPVKPTGVSGLSDAAKIGTSIGVTLPILILLIAVFIISIVVGGVKGLVTRQAKSRDFTLSWLRYYTTGSFGATNESTLTWTNILSVDEPRCLTLASEAPADLQVTDLYQPQPGLSLVDEYKKLPVGSIHPCTVARRPENSELNSSRHSLPYDHSRVELASASTYINASYLPGYDQRRNAYIAAATPFNAQTVSDFWLMVYQEHVSQVSL
jgi:hypothetical protein